MKWELKSWSAILFARLFFSKFFSPSQLYEIFINLKAWNCRQLSRWKYKENVMTIREESPISLCCFHFSFSQKDLIVARKPQITLSENRREPGPLRDFPKISLSFGLTTTSPARKKSPAPFFFTLRRLFRRPTAPGPRRPRAPRRDPLR